MRKSSFVILSVVLLSNLSFAQFKEIPYETKTKLKSNNLIFGFINPKNFSLTHSINISYVTSGNASASVTSYTGTLAYRILDNLRLSADVTMQYSPFATLGSSNPLLNKEFQNSLNGVYLSRVSLDYSPFKNMFINIQYFNNKNNYFWFDDYYFSRWDDF
jgi:hypothetical protein